MTKAEVEALLVPELFHQPPSRILVSTVGLPDLALMLTDALVAFDHLKHTVTILVNVYADDERGVDAAHADALATIEKARRLLHGPVPDFGTRPVQVLFFGTALFTIVLAATAASTSARATSSCR